MIPNDKTIETIAIGESASFERTFTAADVQQFAALSGDENPLHLDDAYAEQTQFKKRVVHGMLVGALCSTLVGMYLPGKRCLYLAQTLSFKKPVFIGDTLRIKGIVISKSLATRIIEVAIEIDRNTDRVVEGVATVQILP